MNLMQDQMIMNANVADRLMYLLGGQKFDRGVGDSAPSSELDYACNTPVCCTTQSNLSPRPV